MISFIKYIYYQFKTIKIKIKHLIYLLIYNTVKKNLVNSLKIIQKSLSKCTFTKTVATKI